MRIRGKWWRPATWYGVSAVLAVLLLCVGCHVESPAGEPEPLASPTPGFFIPTLPPDLPVFFPRQVLVDGEWVRMTGEIRGNVVEVDGCLRVNGYLVIWPPHYSLAVENDVIHILDERGASLAVVGEEVYMGGGEKPSLAEVIGVNDEVSQAIPPECSGPYWLSGGILPNE